MAQIKYVGPFDEVEVPVLGITAKQGVPVEIDTAPAQVLAEQADWELVDTTKASKANIEEASA